jgi:hypothetical protein
MRQSGEVSKSNETKRAHISPRRRSASILVVPLAVWMNRRSIPRRVFYVPYVWNTREMASIISAGSAIRPGPTCPQLSQPLAGSTIW